MRNMLKWMAVGSLLAATAGMATAQDVILNSLPRITGAADGVFVGIDPGSSSPAAPQTFQNAGYAVLPFLTTAAAANEQVNSITIAGVFSAPNNASASSNLNSLYGVFIEAPTGNSLSANTSNVVGSFFQFNAAQVAANPLNTSQGDGAFHNNFTATSTTGPVLKGNTQYWLVVLPKSDLTPTTSSDALTDIFKIEARSQAVIRNANLSTLFASEQAGLQEGTPQYLPGNGSAGGAQPADQLSAVNNSGTPLYFGAQILASQSAAPVPETSTLLTLSLGAVVMGGGLLRSRVRKSA